MGMADPTAPDLTAARLPWPYSSYWCPGDFDPACLIVALKAQPGLEDQTDSDGNVQSMVRLDVDADPATNQGFWVTIPTSIDSSVINAAAAAYTPPPPPVATSGDIHATADSIITTALQTASILADQIPTALDPLLAQAESAIPYYEGYTLNPDPATAWTNFQALDQATKDRLLYNCCRTVAALMRYLSGNLQPTA